MVQLGYWFISKPGQGWDIWHTLDNKHVSKHGEENEQRIKPWSYITMAPPGHQQIVLLTTLTLGH